MFAVHVANPFTSTSRREERDKKIMENHHRDREQRDATRKAAWESNARSDGVNRSMQSMGGAKGKSSLADRAKYQFEADSEDDEMENEIDSNLGMLIHCFETRDMLLTGVCRCPSWCCQATQPARPRNGR